LKNFDEAMRVDDIFITLKKIPGKIVMREKCVLSSRFIVLSK